MNYSLTNRYTGATWVFDEEKIEINEKDQSFSIPYANVKEIINATQLKMVQLYYTDGQNDQETVLHYNDSEANQVTDIIKFVNMKKNGGSQATLLQNTPQPKTYTSSDNVSFANENIGDSVKSIATLLTVVSAIGFVIWAIVLFAANNPYVSTILPALGVLVGGGITCYIEYTLVYAFGCLVNNSFENKRILKKLLQEKESNK